VKTSFGTTHPAVFAAVALLSAAVLAVSARADSGAVSYNRQIRPLLSENCFRCHGPDSGRRKSGLRLDQPESAYGKAESGEVAIVPGKPEQSELIRRITATDDDLMPPAKEHKPLKPADIALLRRWVQEGGHYEEHWAFQKVQSPAVPNGDAWVRNPIDAFVAERLRSEGLRPAPEEEKARLIRRVSLDLTGLPPTVEDVDAFVHDTSPDAYEKVVDRLLASLHFGERMAVPWLDLARHSDTGGYHNDSFRTTWMWRDWVVKAFNDNKPFDQFTIEQLAGDLLPNASVDNKIASGFMRNVMTSDEGGILDDEYLNLYIVDRVGTLGTTWLGMTVACAQCHDHKYDPVTQRDFYSLYAFFHNVPERGKDGVRDRNPEPRMTVASPEQETRLAKFDADIKAAETSARQLATSLDARQAEWERHIAARPQAAEPDGELATFPLQNDAKPSAGTDLKFDVQVKGEGSFAIGRNGNCFHSDGKGWIDCGQQFGFERDQPFSVAAWLTVGASGGSPLGKMDTTTDVRGWDIEFHGTKPSVHLIHSWPAQAIHIQGQEDLSPDTLTHIAFTYDGSGKAAGLKLFINGVQAKTNTLVDNLAGSIKTDAPFSIGRRGGVAVPFHGTIEDVRIYPRALTGMELAELGGAKILSIAAVPLEKRTPQQKQELQSFFRASVATDMVKAQRELEDLRKQKADFEKSVPDTMVMVEMEQPRDTFIKVRGQYDKNGEKVTANTPHFLPPLPAQPINGKRFTRLDLAKWLVSPDQPLVARVEANRLWAIVFGTGLVKTLNDFGSQGEWPSHPELLDWLAADFMRDWDIKRAVRQMVTSATYRQSSRITADSLERDSANRLLARGPRNRLDAEFIRDNALAVGGLLNVEVGGKPVFPAQPPGIWEVNDAGGGSWKQQHDAGQYRRGIYVYHRRSTPYPSLLTFDAPSREVCTAIRARSSTPLQSLVLMNDPVYVEAARALAQRAMSECPTDPESRLERMWRLVLARPIADPERAVLERTLSRQLEKYRQDKAAAEALTSVGDLPRPKDADVGELAAWTTVASVILNMNEAITD
jgi:mono/diheme cytochrome c family protein